VGKRRERPVLIGTPDGNAKIPEVNRRATLGANDHGQFCLVDRPITERRYLTRKRHLYVAAALIAQEGDRNVRDLKSAVVRRFSNSDQLLAFLYRFLQSSGDWCDIKDGPLRE